jgi:N-acylneuraminate cytidylyltransferase
MKSLAIIPARGGSKRIPRKNIRPFCGYPILKYPIEIALTATCFDEVMVSTEDGEIAELAKEYGASVPFYRSDLTSSDASSTMDVIKEVIHMYEQIGVFFDYICCLYPTAVFIKPRFLNETLKMMIDSKADSLVSIVKYSYPIQRALQFEKGKIKMLNPNYVKFRTQDIEQMYHDAGQFYWLRPQIVLQNKEIFNNNSYGFELPEIMVQDIDNEMDWKLAEIKYEIFLKKDGEYSNV